MKIFFDTEFTELSKNGQLISIGMISEDNKEFYAELNDIESTKVSEWIKENVLDNTINYGTLIPKEILDDETNYVVGSKEDIKIALEEYLDQFEEVELISDVCHYDMVYLIDIFGTAFDLPKNVNPACHDINQDIANYENITEIEAFDRNREDFIFTYNTEVDGVKHNSLYDAKVIKEIYEITNAR